MANKFYRKDANINVYVVNNAEYKISKKLVGDWVSLPIDEDDFEDFLKTIGNPEEITIHAYKNNSSYKSLKLEDYRNIKEFKELCGYTEYIDPSEVDILNALYEVLGDLKASLTYLDLVNYVFYKDMTMEEVAREYIKDCCGVSEDFRKYIDYKALAYDMEHNNYYETPYGVIEILRVKP